MEYISKRLRALTTIFVSSQAKMESPRKIRRNIYCENFFKVLSWNDPYLSWGSFLALNFLFWLMLQLELKPLGIIFFVILTLFIYDCFFNNTGLSSGQSDFSEEVEQCFCILNSFYFTITILRKESPALFCLAMSIFFLILSFIARSTPGILLIYLTMLGIFFVPMGYIKLPVNVKIGIKDALRTLLTSQDIIGEDELMPLQSQGKVDDDGDLESLDTDLTAESVTNSLISGISSMPSFMDAEDNHEIQEEDLLPLTASMNREETTSFADLSSDSDSELREMRFKESHFSRDSSSDDGSKFEEGLHFTEETVVDSSGKQEGTNRLVQGFVDYIASASTKGFQLPGFVNNALTSMQDTKVTRESSSSDSDFEIINPDDVK